MTMLEAINMTIGLLNTIQVSGENNLDALCASIKNLKSVSNAIVKAEKEANPNETDDRQRKDV